MKEKLFVLTVALPLLLGCAVPVEMTDVGRRSVREYIAEDATTRLGDEYVLDMPLSGTLQRIDWEVGDVVKTGEVICRIEPYMLEQQIREIEALIQQSRAQVDGVDAVKPKQEDIDTAILRVRELRDGEEITQKELSIAHVDYDEAEKKHNRAQGLLKEHAVSQSFFDAAQRTYKTSHENIERARLNVAATTKAREIAELSLKRLQASTDDNEYMRDAYLAEIDALKSRLNVMGKDLEKTVIKSPVTGSILEKYVEDRRVLAAGTPILKIGDMSSIEIECDVLSEEVPRVRIGQDVEIFGKALGGKVVMGTVTRVHPAGFKKLSALGIEQQRVRVVIAFDDAQAELRPGTSIDLRIITNESKNALSIPERATFRHGDGWAVFVVNSRTARTQPIVLGLKNDDWAEVIQGLEEGTVIIAEPTNDLKEGARVVQADSE